MVGELPGRGRELRAVSALLERALLIPAVLVLDGQAGIGKTTVCRAAAEAAERAGFAVLSTTGAAAEVTLAWAALADLVGDLDPDALTALSPLHRQALQAIVTGANDSRGDERLLSTAFRNAVAVQCRDRPTLIIVDDAQWIDEASRRVIGFALRRLAGPVAVLIAYRNGDHGSPEPSWVQPADPRALNRVTVGPIPEAQLRAILGDRLGIVPPPSAMARIHRLSGGNPFYAIELARALDGHTEGHLAGLPTTLAEVVRQRIGPLDTAAYEALVAVAAALQPTTDLLSAVTGCTGTELVALLQPLESRGILMFDGSRVSFTHPLLSTGVVANADPAVYRRVHRRLAEVVDHPEQRARHLALGTVHGDPDTLKALDVGAESAAARGAYTTAAELVDMAIRHGGDDQIRRLRCAEYLFRAGALDDADALAGPLVDELPAGFMRTVGLMLAAAIRGYRDGVASTIGMLRRAVLEAGEDRVLRTQATLLLALATGIGGDMAACVELARVARDDADATELPMLRCQALTLWAHVSFMYGLGTDATALDEALKIAEPDSSVPIMLQPAPIHALNNAWRGHLVEARSALTEISRQYADLGSDIDVLWAAEQLTMIDTALGHYSDADRTASDALQRALQVGGRLPLITAHTAVANAAAHRGLLEETRVAAEAAVADARAADLHYLVRPPLISLGFAEVSAGRYEAALRTLSPLLDVFDPVHDIEIMAGGFLPDAVEALTATGRLEEAATLAAALEAGGSLHDRAWMLATGARCRAMVSAARGDLDAALASAQRAMEHHDRLPMPLERARTQLLLGQLLRRRRRVSAARTALTEAAAAFEQLESPLWAARARQELARLDGRPAGTALTETERCVAEHAAAGLTNRQIGAALYLSVKTVEMHLSNAYRKLGVRSRTQLAARLRKDADSETGSPEDSA